MDLVRLYISRGRFGEFVANVIEAENARRAEQAEKDEDWKLWLIYVHSYSDESFSQWKKRVTSAGNQNRKTSDYDLTDEGIQSIIDSVFEQ